MGLPLGAVVDGFKVVKALGDGGFAFVYLVEKSGKRYALKLARHRDASGDDKRTHARTLRELGILLLFADHPNTSYAYEHAGHGGLGPLALDWHAQAEARPGRHAQPGPQGHGHGREVHLEVGLLHGGEGQLAQQPVRALESAPAVTR
jgi:hypothetical protein